jgi:hypothetical protein
MEHYRNLGGDSGVSAFEIGADYIRVEFKDGSMYLYTYASTGAARIEQMKSLALQGHGLNAYINTSIGKAYERKER